MVECFYLGELCVLLNFSVKLIAGPCVSVRVNASACINGSSTILLHGKVDGEEGGSRLFSLRLNC